MRIKETQLASILASHIIKMNEDKELSLHAEVVIPGTGIADLVAIVDGYPTIYETKASPLSFPLLSQCIDRLPYARRVIACVPMYRMEARESELAMAVFSSHDVGVIEIDVDSGRWQGKAPKSHRGGTDKIIDLCNEHNRYGGSFAPPGTKTGRRATKTNIKVEEILDKLPLRASTVAKALGISATRLIKQIKTGRLLGLKADESAFPTIITKA